jgi:ABC-type transport system substrate-binding protein
MIKPLNVALAMAMAMLFVLPALGIADAQATQSEIVFRCAIKPGLETNPLLAGEDSWKVLGLVYEGATARSAATGELLPYIAVGSANMTSGSGPVSWGDCIVGDFGYCPKDTWADPSKPEVVIFYDFTDVRWHDGVPMTVRDIMFSFQVHSARQEQELGHPLKDQNGRQSGNYSETNWLHIHKAYESLDGTRAALRFVLQKPYYSVFQHYLEQYILPYHIWGGRLSGQFADSALLWFEPGYNVSLPDSWKLWVAERWSNPAPVGSGRFMWSSGQAGAISLVPFAGHFHRPGFKYYSRTGGLSTGTSIDRIQLVSYASETSAVLDLESRKIDHIAWSLEPASANRFVNDNDIVATQLRSAGTAYLAFNMGRPSLGYVPDSSYLAGLRDAGKPLRRAMAHCVDSQGINFMTSVVTPDTGSRNAFFDWDNSSAPSYGYDPQEAISILRKSGYVLTDPTQPPGEGNWWLNSDGSPISRLAGNMITIAIDSDDQIAFRAGTMMVSQMRSVGIPVTLLALEYDLLEQKILQRDFDLCILRHEYSDVQSSRPENYLFGRFHSMAMYGGQNFVGYRNSSFDGSVENAMASPSRRRESALVQNAFAAMAFDVPVLGLYNPSNVEAYRADAFTGFVDDGSGSLLNPASMSKLRRENRQALLARFTNIPLTASANATLELKMKVTDQAGNPVSGAEVFLDSTAGSLSAESGFSDAQGLVQLNFTTPGVPESQKNGTSVMVSIVSAAKEGYRDAPARNSLITVYPEGTMLLFVSAQALQDVVSSRDAFGSAGITYLEIAVTDERNLPVADASVTILVEGVAMVPDRLAGLTDRDGTLSIGLTAPEVSVAGECTITVTASKVAHVSGSAQASIMIVPYREQAVIEQPGGSGIWVYGAVPAFIALACIAYLWRKRGRNRP